MNKNTKTIIASSVAAALLASGTFAQNAELTAPAPMLDGFTQTLPTSSASDTEGTEALFDRIALTGIKLGDSAVTLNVSMGVPTRVTGLAYAADGEIGVTVRASADPVADGWNEIAVSETAEKVNGYTVVTLDNEEAYTFYSVTFTAEAGAEGETAASEIAFYSPDDTEPRFRYVPSGVIEEGETPRLFTADEIARLKKQAGKDAETETFAGRRLAFAANNLRMRSVSADGVRVRG